MTLKEKRLRDAAVKAALSEACVRNWNDEVLRSWVTHATANTKFHAACARLELYLREARRKGKVKRGTS